jgi:predicted nucleotidyltransferase
MSVMARDWETWLRNSIGPASHTEEQDRDRIEKRIREAILADGQLAGAVRVFVKGSYANGTNVRRDSDVDIAVEWKQWSYISKAHTAAKSSWDQLGVPLGHNLAPSPGEYRRLVEHALLTAFGSSRVDVSGNKAITVAGGPTTLDADVVPCFRHQRYDAPDRNPHVGIRIYPKNGGQVENWPEQNRLNGIRKNDTNNTRRRYKEFVRAFKRLENDMVTTGRLAAEVHGYFIECLLYNLPNQLFLGDSYKSATKNVLAALWHAIQNDEHTDWIEVNGLKWLWRSGQTWTAEEAADFAHKAWNYVNSG